MIRFLGCAAALLAMTVSAFALTGYTPVVSGGAVSALIVTSSPATQFQVYATNLTTTPGFLVGYNATAVPADGALTPGLVQECLPLPASGSVLLNDQPGPGSNYTVGIVYILTSASTCYTKTTGTLVGFIKAKAL